MSMSTPIRIGLGVGIAALAIAGFAIASGQLMPAKTNATSTSPLQQTTNQISARDDDDRDDHDDHDDRYEHRIETRVIDAKTGKVLTEEIRRAEDRSDGKSDPDKVHDRDDQQGGRDDD